MPKYFVAYVSTDGRGASMGRTDVIVDKPPEHIEDIATIENIIRQDLIKKGFQASRISVVSLQKFPIN